MDIIDVNSFDSLIELSKALQINSIPLTEYEKYVNRYLEFKAREHHVPLHGSFELTSNCNLNCKMCYVHLSGMQESKPPINGEAWKRLFMAAYEAGMLRATLTGGECLLHPDFDELYLFLLKLGIKVTILTNGVLLDEKKIAFFTKNKARHIQISLYGSSDDAYEKVTGKRIFHQVFDHLLMLKQEKLPFSVAVTPNHFMADDVKSLLRLLEENQIPYDINSNLIMPREKTGRKLEDLTVSEYVALYQYKNTLQNKSTKYEVQDILPEENQFGTETRGVRCGAGKSSFAIRYDGKMCPCLSLGELTANTDPLDDSFAKAWKEVNEIADNYLMPSECTNCVYQPICLVCPAMHRGVSEPGHCNPRICEKTKALVANGFLPNPGHINKVK